MPIKQLSCSAPRADSAHTTATIVSAERSTSPSVRIVLVNFNGVDYIRRAIDSAFAQNYDGRVEVAVIDNCSTDDSVAVLRRMESLVLIENELNTGYGAGANRAALDSETEYVAFLNPDAVADPTWLSTLIPWMRDGGVDFASSIVRAGENTYFAGGRYLKNLGSTLLRTVAHDDTDWISGCALVARTAAFRLVGGFDERFFLYYEDVDLSLRAIAAGLKLAVLPVALVDHPSHGLSTNQLGRRKAEIAYASRGRLIAKHVARPWHPFALAFTALLSPLVNGARPLDLLRISRAVARGYRSAGNAETFSKREPRPQTRATIGILANIFEPGAGILAGGHLHFIEVVKRWRNVNLVVFAPEIARADIGAALPQATFVPLPSPNYLHRAKALMFLYRSFAAIKQLRALRRCDAFLATSHLLPDVLPPIVARRPTAVVVHHLITSKRDEASALALTSALGERLSLALIRLGARTLVAGSPMMLRELRARGFDLPAVVTTNGVDHLRFPVVNLDGASRSGAVFVGRLHPAKNPADAIRAWAIVAAKFPNEKLTIIGKAEISDYALELQNLVSELGLAERVDFAGAVSDAEKLTALIRARVFLFPSREEGWGIAVAEAMRAGLPCVTYDLPIFREIFPQGRLAAKMHDYEALARQVVSLLSDEPLRIHYAREAAQLAETFTWANASQVEAAAVAGMLPAQCETIASHA